LSYPIALKLQNRRCVVVGGGKVALRKVTGLLAAGAEVYVISREITPELASFASAGNIRLHMGEYEASLLEKIRPSLVFAATNNPLVNQQVAWDAEKMGALVNLVDAPETSDFTNMATLHHGPIMVAVSTEGSSPLLATYLKQQIAHIVGPEYAILAGWMGEVRSIIQNEIPCQADRSVLWRVVLESAVLDLLQAGEIDQARLVFEQLITASLLQV
jgi:precorrin-2 dehydrogenase/sirohydrochlorin ferrochelatase